MNDLTLPIVALAVAIILLAFRLGVWFGREHETLDYFIYSLKDRIGEWLRRNDVVTLPEPLQIAVWTDENGKWHQFIGGSFSDSSIDWVDVNHIAKYKPVVVWSGVEDNKRGENGTSTEDSKQS